MPPASARQTIVSGCNEHAAQRSSNAPCGRRAPIDVFNVFAKPRSLIRGRAVTRIRRYRPADAALESVAEVGPWLPWSHAGHTLENGFLTRI